MKSLSIPKTPEVALELVVDGRLAAQMEGPVVVMSCATCRADPQSEARTAKASFDTPSVPLDYPSRQCQTESKSRGEGDVESSEQSIIVALQ